MEGLSLDVVKQLGPQTEAATRRAPGLLRVVRGQHALRRWAIVSLIMNIVIVVTGGLVRLTGSGLGCPTWPRCTADSYVSHPELGIHGAIEFGNRLLTFVLIIVALLTLVSALTYRENGRPRPDLRWLAGGLALGIPLQGVIGGIAVLTQLNPYVVGLHFLLSMVLIALAVWLVRKAWHLEPTGVSAISVIVTRITFVLMWLAVWLGTLVTGSGPHAGDEERAAQRPRRHAGDALTHERCLRHHRRKRDLLRAAAQSSRAAVDLGRDPAGRHRHSPIPVGAAHRSGRAAPARRFAGHCHGHQPDALGAAFRLKASGQVSHHAVRRLPSQRRHRWILASTSPWDPSTLTALPTSSLRTRRASVT